MEHDKPINAEEAKMAWEVWSEEFRKAGILHVEEQIRNGEWGKPGEGTAYMGLCGWTGRPMAPLTRAAFVAQFGEALTAIFEESAKLRIRNLQEFWAASNAKRALEEAERLSAEDCSKFQVGQFLLAYMDGCKCDHCDLGRVLRHFIDDKREHEEEARKFHLKAAAAEPFGKKHLCKITRIAEVEDIEADMAGVLNKVQWPGNEGGTMSDDVEEGEFSWQRFTEMPQEYQDTFYTLTVLVRDKKGKWILVDPEGYDYPRYVLMPLNFPRMFEASYLLAEETIKRKETEAKMEAEAKERALRKAYDERCAKWEGLMQPVPAGTDKWTSEFRSVGKRNIMAMAKSVFPWIRFSVSYSHHWGAGYTLKWTNGPTEDEVSEALDLGLFCPSRDTFDGMTDCADVEYSKFTDFADKFGGVRNGVRLQREEAETDHNRPPKKEASAAVQKAKTSSNAAPAEATATVHRNKEKKGVEVSFPSAPSAELLEKLHQEGFHWSRRNRCWYRKEEESTFEVASEIVKKFNEKRAAA